jgi:hypothetical protein
MHARRLAFIRDIGTAVQDGDILQHLPVQLLQRADRVLEMGVEVTRASRRHHR